MIAYHLNMLLPTKSIVLLTLGAGALSFPAALSSNTTLEDRDLVDPLPPNPGQIAAFNNPTCDNFGDQKRVGDLLQDDGNSGCIVFNTEEDNIGINWSDNDPNPTVELIAFKDSKCTDRLLVIFPNSTYNTHQPHPYATSECISQKSTNATWMSVMFPRKNDCDSKKVLNCGP